MEDESVTFEEWLKWAFDHPAPAKDGKEWYWDVPDVDEGGRWLDRPPVQALTFATKLFENPLAYLSCYSDAQIGEGIWFIVFRTCSKHFDGLVDPSVDLGLRTRCIRSLENLSRELFAPRCSDNGVWYATDPLDQICYMLWDLVVSDTSNIDPEIDKVFLDTLARILAIPCIACQQSALHGLGHLVRYTKLGADVIQQFLDDHPNLREDLRKYAQKALVGAVL
jgi:hypothetical protein